jgi:hypothetical protein
VWGLAGLNATATYVGPQQLLGDGLVALARGQVQCRGALGAVDCVHAVKKCRQQRVGPHVEQHRESLLAVGLHCKVRCCETCLGAHVHIAAQNKRQQQKPAAAKVRNAPPYPPATIDTCYIRHTRTHVCPQHADKATGQAGAVI